MDKVTGWFKAWGEKGSYIKLREVACSFQSCLIRERSAQGSSDQTTHTEGTWRKLSLPQWDFHLTHLCAQHSLHHALAQ